MSRAIKPSLRFNQHTENTQCEHSEHGRKSKHASAATYATARKKEQACMATPRLGDIKPACSAPNTTGSWPGSFASVSHSSPLWAVNCGKQRSVKEGEKVITTTTHRGPQRRQQDVPARTGQRRARSPLVHRFA